MNGKQKREHSVALWAGITALFTNLAAVAVVDILGSPSKSKDAIAAVITSIFIGVSVYSKQRWDDAKEEKKGGK